MSDRRERVEELCDAALDRSASERAEFVAARCGDDLELRREVEALLVHAEVAEGFLATPVGAVAAEVFTEEHGALVDRQVGPYKILSLLGAGGMGEVYRARDNKLDRDVALKVVPARFLAIPGRPERFELEARVLATLNHPHIGAIYGVEDVDGIRALVLELVEGATLADRVFEGPLSVPDALDAARQIAEALEAAHDKGIIHRDLKPANVKITPNGTVKVLDFGLAKVFATEEAAGDGLQSPVAIAHSHEGAVQGTTAYMSPEQARGRPVDRRTDIWAFGCVVYEMLTGRPAFTGETSSDTIVAVLEREPDWSLLPQQIPPAIRRLLHRCLQKDSRRRLRDIGDARLELEDALASLTSPSAAAVADPPSPTDRQRTARWWSAGWIAASVGLLAVAGITTWQLRRTDYFWRSPLENAVFTTLTDLPGAEHHAAISRDGKFVTFLSDRDGAWDAWVAQIGAGDVYNLTKGSVRELRNPATRTLGFSPDGSIVTLWSRVTNAEGGGRVYAGWSVPTLGGTLRPFLEGITEISELDWSPDGRRLVHHPPAPGDPLFVTEVEGRSRSRQVYAATAGFHNHFPLWSRDGAFIYFVHGLPAEKNDLWRIPAAGGSPERMTFHDARVTFPTWVNDRTLLYLATDDDGYGPWIHAMDVKRRIPHRLFTGTDSYASIAASADGRRLVATVSRVTTSGLWRVAIGDRVIGESGVSVVPLPTANGLSPRPQRGYLVYRGQRGGREGVWRVSDTAPATELWNGANGRVVAGPAVAVNGRLAFVVRRQGRTQLYVMNGDGSGGGPLAEALDVRGSPAWSPDGKWLAIAAANAKGVPQLFKVSAADGAAVKLVDEYSTDPMWAPSGRFLIYSGADVGTLFPVKAVGADGAPFPMRALTLTRGGRRAAFLSDDALIIMKGDVSHKDFWHLDLRTGRERQLTNLRRGYTVGDFGVSPDGREIIFDRTQEESDIVVFHLPER